MNHLPMERRRPWFMLGMLVLVAFTAYPFLTPGISLRSAPKVSPATYAAGKELFEREWMCNDPLAEGDGLGPVFNGTSCAECHSLGGLGGAGDLRHNVLTFEVIPTRGNLAFQNGQVHARAIAPKFKESQEKLRTIFPVVSGGVVRGSSRSNLDPVGVVSTNSTSLFGAGWIDRIPVQAIRYRANSQLIENTKRELGGDFGAVPEGRMRVLPDGRIGRFGWKAQFATLEEFVAAACSNEIGLGTPIRNQAAPMGHQLAKVKPDLNKERFAALVGFVEGLPRPQVVLPSDPKQRDFAAKGKQLFNSIGCTCCHTESLGGVSGIYSDLLLHRIENFQQKVATGEYQPVEELEVPLPPDHPKPDEWRTAPLWGVADSAPYFHDGASPTLHDAIVRHQGGAAAVTQKYSRLPGSDQQAIIAFLQTLRAPADADPIRPPPAKLAKN